MGVHGAFGGGPRAEPAFQTFRCFSSDLFFKFIPSPFNVYLSKHTPQGVHEAFGGGPLVHWRGPRAGPAFCRCFSFQFFLNIMVCNSVSFAVCTRSRRRRKRRIASGFRTLRRCTGWRPSGWCRTCTTSTARADAVPTTWWPAPGPSWPPSRPGPSTKRFAVVDRLSTLKDGAIFLFNGIRLMGSSSFAF